MNIKIESIHVDKDPDTNVSVGSGLVILTVNNKYVEVTIHACGEYDFEGDSISDTEFNDLLDFLSTSPEIEDAFPSSEY